MLGFIYIIKNNINDKVYIGKTYLAVEKRFEDHKKDCFRERNSERPIYKAMKKYGLENFSISKIGEYEEGLLEEKEIDFIKKYNSYIGFDNSQGYNATLGGDGRRYLNLSEEEVIAKYKELKFVNKTADYFNCSYDSIRIILDNNNVEIKKYTEIGLGGQFKKEKVTMMDNKGKFLYFDSVIDAAKYLVDNEIAKCKVNSARVSIGRAISGLRKTYLGFHWSKGQ